MDLGYLALLIPVMLFALSCHEMAHAWMALRFGDPTARDLGRVTLNPLRHLDPLGTLMVIVAGFGWAKPVPVDERNLRDPLRDGLWIAAAGPGANFLAALGSGILLQLLVRNPAAVTLLGFAAEPALGLLSIGVQLNLALAVFNLIPLHPLDGSRVLKGLLSREHAARLAMLDAAGPLILLALLVAGRATGTSLIGLVMGPIVGALRHLVSGGLM
jgi:Zn-dependent protease